VLGVLEQLHFIRPHLHLDGDQVLNSTLLGISNGLFLLGLGLLVLQAVLSPPPNEDELVEEAFHDQPHVDQHN